MNIAQILSGPHHEDQCSKVNPHNREQSEGIYIDGRKKK